MVNLYKMKIRLLVACMICSIAQLHAQKQNVYSGISTSRDSIMRHNEAFFHAFIAFATDKDADATNKAVIRDDRCSPNSDGLPLSASCYMKIISDIIKDSGEEIVTISIGSGSPLKYDYVASECTTDSEVRNHQRLDIVYLDDKFDSFYEYEYFSVISLDAAGETSVPLTKFSVVCSSVTINNK